MPNSSAMKVACAIESYFATHLNLPFRITCTASIPCKVRQAVNNEPYPFASQVRFHVDHLGHAIAGRTQGLAEEAFGPGRVPFGREQEFDGLAGRVHCAIQV